MVLDTLGCGGASYVEVNPKNVQPSCSLCKHRIPVKWKVLIDNHPGMVISERVTGFTVAEGFTPGRANVAQVDESHWWMTPGLFGRFGNLVLKPSFAVTGPAAGRAKGSIRMSQQGIGFPVVNQRDAVAWSRVRRLEVRPGRRRRRSILTVELVDGESRQFEVYRLTAQRLEAKVAPITSHLASVSA